MAKKVLITIFILITGIYGMAQRQNIPPTYSSPDNSAAQGFDKSRLFLGGSLALGFGSYSFNIGSTPEVGYSFSDYLDAGIALNLNYQSIRADPYYNGNVRQRSFNYGGGPFVRVFPLRQLFIQGQFEHNWIDYNFKDMTSGLNSSQTNQSSSLLAGIGYTQRIVGQSSFYTVLMIDLLTDQYSPYRDYYNNAAIPIIRAGFTFYLHQHRK